MPEFDASRYERQLEHLAHVEALSCEVAGAISAIQSNDLQGFRDHLGKQESICARLSDPRMLPPFSSANELNAGMFQGVPQQICEAHRALAQLNRVYTAVLRKARRTAVLLATVYRSHGQVYDPAAPPVLKSQTWSCEV